MLVDLEMNQHEKRDLLEVAMQAVGQVLNDQQNRVFGNGAIRPDRFPCDAYPNWVQWKKHFVAVVEVNRWTDIQAINAIPVCLNGQALDEFIAAPTELKRHVNGEPDPSLQALFEYLDRTLGVLRNDRWGRKEFEALAQMRGESLRDFARRVRNTGILVYNNMDAEQRDELFRERFIEGLSTPELTDVLLRESSRTFRETMDRVIDLEAIATSIRRRRNDRIDALRLTQEAETVNSRHDLELMKEQLNGLTVAVKCLTETTTQFVGALAPGGSTDVDGQKSQSDVCCAD